MTASRLVIPDLAGKNVLITGGSTGIGAAVAKGFAEQGARVAIGYHSSADKAHALVSEIKAAGGEALAVKGDVADPKACADIVAETTNQFGGLDGLINNAGLMLGRVHSLEASDEHVQAVIDLNARSILWVTRAARPWLERQGGFVINTTSIAARNGGAGGAILYAAAKGFVSTITKGHAKELIDKKIRVNGVVARRHHDAVPRTLYKSRGAGDHSQDDSDCSARNSRRLRRRLPVPRLGGAERLRRWADYRGQRRPAYALRR